MSVHDETRWTMRLPGEREPVVERSGALALDDPLIAEVRVEATLENYDGAAARHAERLRFAGTAEYRAVGECSRCLEPASIRVRIGFATMVDLSAGTTTPLDMDSPAEERGFELSGEGEIDLTDELRQRICLAVPPLLYCRSDCRGLCPRCGANLNEGRCSCPEEGVPKGGKFDVLARLLEKPESDS